MPIVRAHPDTVGTSATLQENSEAVSHRNLIALSRSRLAGSSPRRLQPAQLLFLTKQPRLSNSKKMPQVSVIIPVYNRKELLKRAVASVCAQAYRNFELIVVDDASTDGIKHGELPVSSDVPLTWLSRQHHCGVSAARNAGAAASSGAWLSFLDSDDEWHPKKLARQVAWMIAHPSFRICQTREIWIRRGKRVNPPATHIKTAGNLFKQSLQRCMITPSSVLLERSLFTHVGGFNESLPACEDYDLWLRICRTQQIGLVDEYLLTRYGGHCDQLSATIPLLDRFRIRSMLDLLRARQLTPVQQAAVIKQLQRKAAIVANGYRKRGRLAESRNYCRLADKAGAID
ncbi:MAG: glycosyltransferase [Chitinivibrionales bacterium]|nr:glycosyltransferase [Chitinivibrionales bacterium]